MALESTWGYDGSTLLGEREREREREWERKIEMGTAVDYFNDE